MTDHHPNRHIHPDRPTDRPGNEMGLAINVTLVPNSQHGVSRPQPVGFVGRACAFFPFSTFSQVWEIQHEPRLCAGSR
jgi:hypothetical protein